MMERGSKLSNAFVFWFFQDNFFSKLTFTLTQLTPSLSGLAHLRARNIWALSVSVCVCARVSVCMQASVCAWACVCECVWQCSQDRKQSKWDTNAYWLSGFFSSTLHNVSVWCALQVLKIDRNVSKENRLFHQLLMSFCGFRVFQLRRKNHQIKVNTEFSWSLKSL